MVSFGREVGWIVLVYGFFVLVRFDDVVCYWMMEFGRFGF